MLHIYVVGQETGPVKIGYAKNMVQRMSSLRTGSPIQADLLHCYLTEDADLIERVVHRMMRERRVRGEWFDITSKEAMDAIVKVARLIKSEMVRADFSRIAGGGSHPLRKKGRPSHGKTIVALRLDPAVIDALQADGPGWGARANAVLRKELDLPPK